MDEEKQILEKLAREGTGCAVQDISPIRAHGSARRIYRVMLSGGKSVVGVYNEAVPENTAFIAFARSFRSVGLNVPQIFATDGKCAYIETDLGDITLMDRLIGERSDPAQYPGSSELYAGAVDDLVGFQTKGLAIIDRSLCYQGDRFDAAAIERDVRYFLTEYLARVGLYDGTDDYEEDIAELRTYGENYEQGYFMFRDYQARNIMVLDGSLWYIDFQSGREGPLQYDLASLLFQSQANLSFDLREELLGRYLSMLGKVMPVDESRFRSRFLVYVLIRALQNLGAYGKLGLGQGKQYFTNAIPFALDNCRYLLRNWPNILSARKLRSTLERAVRDA